MSKELLLASSSVFPNSSTIDNIHQSIIDLKDDKDYEDVKNLLNEAISYLDKEINVNLANELFLLISTCFSRYITEFLPIFKIFLEKSRLNSNRIIATASVLSEMAHINSPIPFSDYDSFVNESLNDILPQILKTEINTITVFGQKIPNMFKYDLVIDLLSSSKTLTEELLNNFLPFIYNQKNFSKNPKFWSLVQLIFKNGLTSAIPLSTLADEDFYSTLSIEQITILLPLLSDQLFIQIFPQFERTFNESPNLNSSFILNLIDRCDKSNLKLQKIERAFNFLSPSELNNNVLNQLQKYDFVFPTEFVDQFNNVGSVSTGVSVHFKRSSDDEKSEIKFNGQSFKSLKKLIEKGKKIDEIFDEIIFEKYPPNNATVTFLHDFLNSINKDQSDTFFSSEKNMSFLLKILDKKIIPPTFLLKLVNCMAVLDFLQKNDDENSQPLLYYIYKFSSASEESNNKKPNLNKISVLQLKNESNEKLAEFIEKNDFDLITKLDNESLSVAASALLFAEEKVERIEGLTKENILPFSAIVLNNLIVKYKSIGRFFLLPQFKEIIQEGFIFLANNKSKVLNTSINSILSKLNEKTELIESDFTVLIFDSIIEILLNNAFCADEEKLYRFIFNFSDKTTNTKRIKIDLVKFMVNQIHILKKFKGELKLNLIIFELNELSEFIINVIQNDSSSFDDVINIIFLIENLSRNCPILKISHSEKLMSIARESAKTGKWDEFLLICQFISNFENLNKEFDELTKLTTKEEMKSKLLTINKRSSDYFISLLLNIPNLETNDLLFEDLFNRIMTEKGVESKYLKILIDKLVSNDGESPESILKRYLNEYLIYGDRFIYALDSLLIFNPMSEYFVRRIEIKKEEFLNTDFIDSLLFKLFDLIDQNSEKYQPFFILKNIASCFPFVFENNPEKVFNSVLSSFDNYFLVFDYEEKNLDKIKASITALSFLRSTLYSTKIIDSFCDWLFNQIEKFSNSQVYCFMLIILSLLKSKNINVGFLAIVLKYIDTIRTLIERKLPNKSTFSENYYKILCKILSASYPLVKSASCLIVAGIKNIPHPLCHYFDYKSTIFPYMIKNDDLEAENYKNNKILETFTNEIERNRHFWPKFHMMKKDIQNVSSNQVNDFMNHFQKLVKIPDLKCRVFIKSLKIKTEKNLLYIISKGIWIFEYLFSYESFSPLHEHSKIINEVITFCNENIGNNDVAINFYDIDEQKYFTKLLKNEQLFEAIFDKIDSFYSLIPILPHNDFFVENLLNYCIKKIDTIYENDENNGDLSLASIEVYFPALRNISSFHFKYEFFKNFGKKLVQISMYPQYRSNKNYLLKLAQLLVIFYDSHYPIFVSHLIGFMLLFEDEELIRKTIVLCSKFDPEKLYHLEIIQVVYDRELNKENISPLILTDFCHLYPSVVKARLLDTLNVLRKLLIEYNDKLLDRENKKKLGELIYRMLNDLAPQRNSIQSFSMSDSSTIELKLGNKKFSFQPIPEFVRQSSPKFWELFDEYRSSITEIIESKKEELMYYRLFNDYPELFDFKIRLNYFRRNISNVISYRTKYLKVDRQNILESSFKQFEKKSKEEDSDEEKEEEEEEEDSENIEWLKSFDVKFKGEEGVNQGGLTKDWFNKISKALFDPETNIFIEKEKTRSYQPKSCSINYEYFKFAGKIIARMIIEGLNIEFHLTIPFIKQILYRKISENDLEYVEPIKYKSFQDILNNDIDNDTINEYYFEVTKEGSGGREVVELKENGSQIKVTNENKKEFINLISMYYLRDSIKDQIDAFCEGFDSIIDHNEIRFFSASEFDILLCGVSKIDINELRKGIKVKMPYTDDSPTIVLFFDSISKWEQENLVKLLVFITGSPMMPVGGFKNEMIEIRYMSNKNFLPQAHTCFNQLDLPPYETEDELNQKLMLAIQQESFLIS